MFDSFGTVRTEFGDSDMFQLPIALTTDEHAHYIVCDQVQQRITVHRDNGELLHSVDIPEVIMAHDISCYGNRLYICDGENKIIVVYSYHGNHEDGVQFLTKLTTPEANLIGQDQSEAGNQGNQQAAVAMTTDTSQNAFDNGGHFLDCSAVCTDQHGNLLVADSSLGKVHLINERGEMSHVVPHGKPIRRPTCMAVSPEGYMVVAQQGIDALDHDMGTLNHVAVYKIIRSDV